MSQIEFEKRVNDWSLNLSNKIKHSIQANREVMIVALSRKMPRFFEWLIQNARSEEAITLVNLLKDKNVTFTTEYAIPVVFGNLKNDNSPIDGIVADDVVIFGATANRVCLEWQAFTGTTPYLTTLIRSDAGKLVNSFESVDTLILPPVPIQNLGTSFIQISERIMSSSLPVDMEYPIIHINSPYKQIKEHIERENINGWGTAVIQSEMVDNYESFTILFEDETSLGFNNDFAKARLFKKEEGCCLEIIAPNAIKRASLSDREKFSVTENPDYSEAWKCVFDAVAPDVSTENSEKIENSPLFSKILNDSKFSTLNVWANYLLCLSTFIRHKDLLVPKGTTFNLYKEDISLILGHRKSEILIPILERIIHSTQSVVVPHTDVVLPFYVNPPELKNQYLNLIAMSIDPSAELEQNLDNIFSASHYTSPVFDSLKQNDILGHHNFGETYESLESHLRRVHYGDTKISIKLHKWIDQRIDESRIAPKYELVQGNDNNSYYRRFFLCGSNSFPKQD